MDELLWAGPAVLAGYLVLGLTGFGSALVYGGGIGSVEILFGTAGPVVVAWLTRRLPDPHQVRASIPMVMAVAVLTVQASTRRIQCKRESAA